MQQINTVSVEQICKCPKNTKLSFSWNNSYSNMTHKTKAKTKLLGLYHTEFKMQQKNDKLEGLSCKFKPFQTITF